MNGVEGIRIAVRRKKVEDGDSYGSFRSVTEETEFLQVKKHGVWRNVKRVVIEDAAQGIPAPIKASTRKQCTTKRRSP